MKYLLTIITTLFISASFGQLLFTSKIPADGMTQKGIVPNTQTGIYSKLPVNQPYSVTFSDSTGIPAYRFEVRAEDTPVIGKHRSEIGTIRNTHIANQTFWYGFQTQTPKWQSNITKRESWFQIDDSANNPTICFEKYGNIIRLQQIFCPDGITLKTRMYTVCTENPGERNYWVIFYKPSIENDGEIRLYKNGVQVTFTNGKDENKSSLPDVSTIFGPNASAKNINGSLYAYKKNYSKFGLYCYGIKDASPDPFVKRVLYVSKIQFGGINSTIADFK